VHAPHPVLRPRGRERPPEEELVPVGDELPGLGRGEDLLHEPRLGLEDVPGGVADPLGGPAAVVLEVGEERPLRVDRVERPLGERVLGHQLELEQGGLADEVDGAPRVVDAGELHHDAVPSLRVDRRLGDAELVDAVADDLEGAGDRVPLRVVGEFRRLDLEHEVHPAAQVEPEVQDPARVAAQPLLQGVEDAGGEPLAAGLGVAARPFALQRLPPFKRKPRPARGRVDVVETAEEHREDEGDPPFQVAIHESSLFSCTLYAVRHTTQAASRLDVRRKLSAYIVQLTAYS